MVARDYKHLHLTLNRVCALRIFAGVIASIAFMKGDAS